MSIRRRIGTTLSVLLVALMVSSCAAGPDNNQNSLRPKGEQADTIMNLFTPIFWIAAVIGIGVLLATVYVAFRYRATEKNKDPKQIHGNSVLEIGWTILPLVILIGVAIPTVQTIFEINKPAKADALQVEVVGKQWWWQFAVETDEYTVKNSDGTDQLKPDGNPLTAERVVVANELVIPVNRQVEFTIRACNEETPITDGRTVSELKDANPCNVIHSFWIPSLGGKADAVPGRTNRLVLESDEEGIFTGQCAEYCGLSHGVMRMQVRVVSQEEYDRWIENLKKPAVVEAIAKEGEEKTEAQAAIEKFSCSNCHAFNNPSEKTYGPNLTHYGPDFEDEVLGGGSIEKNLTSTWRWIHNATDWQSGYGIPMQADDCRLGPTPGSILEGAKCVGMPNYSVPYSYKDAEGKKVNYPAMSEAEAQSIAKYLYGNK
jgi:cytochrome c oxidase subunit 2